MRTLYHVCALRRSGYMTLRRKVAVPLRAWALAPRTRRVHGSAQSPDHADSAMTKHAQAPAVTTAQLKAHFVQSAVPMIGFGFMDNTVMIHAGHAIDLTMGVTFGLSTMAAAACGQICSDMAGVTFGGIIEATAGKLGLPSPEFTDTQRNLAQVKRVGVIGAVCGVFCGCSLGLVNLFLIDTQHAAQLKLMGNEGDTSFSVDISNMESEGTTQVTIEGPDIEGVVASVTTAMATNNCKIQDMKGSRGIGEGGGYLQFTFELSRDGEQVEDEDLEGLAKSIMAACKNPERINSLHHLNEALKEENEKLRIRVDRLEAKLLESMVTVRKRREHDPVRQSELPGRDQTSLDEEGKSQA